MLETRNFYIFYIEIINLYQYMMDMFSKKSRELHQLEKKQTNNQYYFLHVVLDSIVSIPACHAGDRGSIPRLGDLNNFWLIFEE